MHTLVPAAFNRLESAWCLVWGCELFQTKASLPESLFLASGQLGAGEGQCQLLGNESEVQSGP